MSKIEHPDIPFTISGASLIYENGAKEAASPEVRLLALCYLKLVEIAENTKPHKLEIKEPEKTVPRNKKPAEES